MVYSYVILKETAWKSTKSSKEYNLGSLWWLLESLQKKLDPREYRSKAFEMNIEYVILTDQQEIELYFNVNYPNDLRERLTILNV